MAKPLEDNNAPVYDLNGRRVGTAGNLNTLPVGIYIYRKWEENNQISGSTIHFVTDNSALTCFWDGETSDVTTV